MIKLLLKLKPLQSKLIHDIAIIYYKKPFDRLYIYDTMYIINCPEAEAVVEVSLISGSAGL